MPVCGVKSARIDQVWERVAPLLEKAIVGSQGFYTADGVHAALKDQRMQLWLAHDGREIRTAMVTSIRTSPGLTCCHIALIGGRDLAGCWEDFDWFCEWARDRGADQIQTETRPGMTRVLKRHGFHFVRKGQAGDIMFKDLVDATARMD